MLSDPLVDPDDITKFNDLQLLHKWMNIPRVNAFWGCAGPQNVQEEHLRNNLSSKNSFPVIGYWDDHPFGYFELYWAKEDILGQYVGDGVGEFDRGIHALVGEQEFRGKHRVTCWLTALAHWAFVQDYRTNAVVLEPRIDNERYVSDFCI
jgi:RimJ/RimL family protein N-acetyltransferase